MLNPAASLAAAVEQTAVVQVVDQNFGDVAARVDFDMLHTVSLADVTKL
jgi:hypothetical protein